MKRKIIAAVLSAALLLTACFFTACEGKKGGPDDANSTDALKPTAYVEQPTDAPVTESPEKTVVFMNSLDVRIDSFYISAVTDTEWGEPVKEMVAAQERVTIPFSDFGGTVSSGVYDIGAVDENGINYDIWEVDISADDTLTLMYGETEDSAILRVTNGGGEFMDYDVQVYDPDDPGSDTKATYPIPIIRCSEYDWDSDELFSYAYLEIDSINTVDDEALEEALDWMNDTVRSIAYDRFDSVAKQSRLDHADAEEYFEPYSVSMRAFIRRADSRAVSVLYELETLTGDDGEDFETYRYYGFNFDSATGARLALEDVVADVSAIPAAINEQMEGRNEDGFMLDEREDYSSYWNDPDCPDFAWLYDYTGVSFIFNDCAFNINEAFLQSVHISFDEHEDFAAEGMNVRPNDYTVYFPAALTQYFEARGTTRPLFVSYLEDETEAGGSTLYMYAGSDLYTEETNCYSFKPMLVHANNEDYIWLFTTSYDDDFNAVSIYTVGPDGSIASIGGFEGSHALIETESAEEEHQMYFYMVVTDPNGFLIDQPTDVLSTVEGSRPMFVNESGLPDSNENLYYFISPLEFTVLKDFTAYETIEGVPTDIRITVRKGTKLLYHATDGVSLALLTLEDGTGIAVDVDKTDWPTTVDGIDIFELFDGLIFAG